MNKIINYNNIVPIFIHIYIQLEIPIVIQKHGNTPNTGMTPNVVVEKGPVP